MTTDAPADLKVDVERAPGSVVHLSIDAPASELDRAINIASSRLASQVRLPGFRPGKAPAAVIERHLGWETIRQEALETLVPTLYLRAADQAGIDPVGEPQVDLDPASVNRGQGISFKITVHVRPEVGLGDYRSLRVEPKHTEITDKDVDEAMAQLQKRNATTKEVERPAQTGDVVSCILEMRHGDELLTAAGQERDLELNPENLIEGLHDQVVGMAAGQDKTFTLRLPADYPREELRGEEVSVSCAVKAVKEQELPALDDELAKKEGQADTIDGLREFYRKALVEQAEQNDKDQFESDVLTAFRDALDVDIPDVMVNLEVDRQIDELRRRFEAMGIGWEQYLAMTNQTVEQLRGERREAATSRVKLELGFDALIKEEGLEVDESAVEREEKRMAEGQKLNSAQRRRLHQALHRDLARQAAGNRLLEIARGQV